MSADRVPAQAGPAAVGTGAAAPVAAEAGGVIHDIGYQRYTGPRLGRGYASQALFVHSVRSVFGLGRGGKAKVFPWLVIGLAFAIAMVVVAVRAQSKQPVLSYLEFTDTVSLLTVLFLAVMAPELVSRDLRSRVLPLYFSRPLRRGDYAFAKLAAAVTAVWMMLAGPQVLMFIGGLFSRDDGFAGERSEALDFLEGISYAAITAVLFGSLAVLLASLSGRRAVGAAAIAGVYLITAPVSAVLIAVGGAGASIGPAVNPFTLLQEVQAWIYHPVGSSVDAGPHAYGYGLTALGLAAAFVALLFARYRKVAA